MTQKELCEMCTEYSVDIKCENGKDCKILSIVKENNELKKEIKKLKNEITRLENDMSYMIDPFCIGDRHEMGG